MKSLNGKTGILPGDVIVINYSRRMFMVKRGEEILNFESFLFNGTKPVDIDEDKQQLWTGSDLNTTLDVLIGIILSATNLTASRAPGLNVGEILWTVEKYPETSLS